MDKSDYKKAWYVYIAECKDSSLYVGIAKDVDKRIKVHNTTNKCRYTRFRKPIKLRYRQQCSDYGTARKRENQIKKFSRKRKFELIGDKDISSN